MPEQATEPGRQDVDDVLTEIQQHGQLGAQLYDGGERRPRIRPQHQIAEDADMGAGRDRQILGQRLHQAEHNRFEEIHSPSYSMV